jgi:hypothetical protein
MKPMVLADIAQAVEMHESTISRVTTQKYLHSPRGIFELKYFFSSHVNTEGGGEASSTAIRALVKKLIAAENPAKPLSDSKLTTMLSEQGIMVARRTVAKYESLYPFRRQTSVNNWSDTTDKEDTMQLNITGHNVEIPCDARIRYGEVQQTGAIFRQDQSGLYCVKSRESDANCGRESACQRWRNPCQCGRAGYVCCYRWSYR